MALTQVKSDGIATGAVTATQIAANAVTVDDIADGSISTAKLADDAVTADKLADTAVTAGSYTFANVTVDAQGRITAASSGTVSSDAISEGNTSAEVVDTGSDGHFKVVTEGTERLRVANDAVYTFTGGNSASDPGEIILSGRNSSNQTRPAGKFLIGPNGTDSWTGEFTLQLRDDGGTFTGRVHVSGKTGNVGINTTSINFPSGSGVEIYDASTPRLKLSNSTTGTTSTDGSYLYVSGSDFLIENKENADMRFYTNATERARITSTGDLRFNSGYGSVATAYGVRAWVNFNGSGTIAIRDDGNVSSLTDNGTGDYTISFTNSMPDKNYALAGSVSQYDQGGADGVTTCIRATSHNTGNLRISVNGDSPGLYDYSDISVAIFR